MTTTEPDAIRNALLSDAESELLVRSLLDQRGDAGVTEDEAATLLNWARLTRFHAAILNLVLRGWARIDLDSDGYPAFHHRPDAQPAPAPDSPRYVIGTADLDDPFGDSEVRDTHNGGAFVAECDSPDEAAALVRLLNDRERYETALKAIAAGAADPAALATVALGAGE